MTSAEPKIVPVNSTPNVGDITAQQELDVLRGFVVHLMGISNVSDLCWYVAQEVVARLGFVDCVVYRFNFEHQSLTQAAAIGNEKNPEKREIFNKLAIPLGRGITGEVALNQRAEIVNDVSVDPRFITDVLEAQSELCVPLVHDGELLGVIDCEDPRKDHFTDRHMQTLLAVASITSAHWAQCLMIDKLHTTRQALSRALSESQIAQRAQATFLASVSHELRTPLNAIVGFSSILTDSTNNALDGDTVVEYSEHIHQAGLHLTKIVDDVLDISALASKKTTPAPKPIAVAYEMDVAIRLLTYKATAHGMEIVKIGGESAHQIMFDPRHFLQIMTNLIDNAIKYSPGTPQIIINVMETATRGLNLSIQDFGMGIGPETLPHIFEPFRRDQEAVNKNIEGSGLGLSLVRELAVTNGADISVSSQKDVGSTFTLELPPEVIIRTEADTED